MAADTSAIMGGEDDSMMISETAGEPGIAEDVTATSRALTADEIREAAINEVLLEAAWRPIHESSDNSKRTDDELKEQEEQEHQDMLQRQKICSAVRTGDIDIALSELQTSYPTVLKPSSSSTISSSSAEIANGSSESDPVKVDLLFRLRCQKFVELVLASHCGSATSPASTASANGDEQDMDVDGNEEGHDDESDVEEDEEIASALIPSRRSASVKETNDARSPKDTPASISMEDVLSYGAELNALYASPPSTTHASSVLFNGEASTQTKQQSQALRDHLSLVFSLVAYSNLNDLKGQIGEICSQDAKKILAEDVNSAMLGGQFRLIYFVVSILTLLCAFQYRKDTLRTQSWRLCSGNLKLFGQSLGMLFTKGELLSSVTSYSSIKDRLSGVCASHTKFLLYKSVELVSPCKSDQRDDLLIRGCCFKLLRLIRLP